MKNILVLRASLTGGDGKVKQKNVDMKASNTLIEAIKRFEGFRGTAYKCPAGVWTIGYGHTVGVKRGDKMTEGEAERQLRRDLAEYEAFVLIVCVWLCRSTQDILYYSDMQMSTTFFNFFSKKVLRPKKH